MLKLSDIFACSQMLYRTQDDMIDRQVLEAESLMSRQTAELPSERAPMLKVSFPFPEVFEQARKEMRSMVK